MSTSFSASAKDGNLNTYPRSVEERLEGTIEPFNLASGSENDSSQERERAVPFLSFLLQRLGLRRPAEKPVPDPIVLTPEQQELIETLIVALKAGAEDKADFICGSLRA
jgi:hypothetical protein